MGQPNGPSIEFLELLTLCAGVFTWSERLRNIRFTMFCDNQAVVTMINTTSSTCKNCMILLRKLVLKSLQMNFRIFATYVSSADNDVADCLSRLDWRRFAILKEKYHLRDKPTRFHPSFGLLLCTGRPHQIKV